MTNNGSEIASLLAPVTSSRRHWLQSSHKSLALVGIGLGMCLLGSQMHRDWLVLSQHS